MRLVTFYLGGALASGTFASDAVKGAEAPPSAATPPVQPIRFARGASSTGVNSAVVRGDRNLYSVQVRAGQRLTLRISALENNAVFNVYLPGARPGMSDDAVEVTGTALPGFGEGSDVRRWSGRLPLSGRYLVVVGGTRGNATYRLAVTLR